MKWPAHTIFTGILHTCWRTTDEHVNGQTYMVYMLLLYTENYQLILYCPLITYRTTKPCIKHWCLILKLPHGDHDVNGIIGWQRINWQHYYFGHICDSQYVTIWNAELRMAHANSSISSPQKWQLCKDVCEKWWKEWREEQGSFSLNMGEHWNGDFSWNTQIAYT